ncbi:MAG: hypothetical protein R3266_05160 [Gemmatimonadota bacterium]|nr:hypothetical protein [Gemmatimonadota bacterium]
MKARLSVVSTALLLLACSGGGSGAPTGTGIDTPPVPPPPPPDAPPPPPSEDRVEPPIGSIANFDIIDDSFVGPNGEHDQEARAEVQVGQLVTWTQNGQHIHRVEFSKVPPDGTSKDSQDLRPLSTWGFRPDAPGQYVFFCR